ncbi:MAG: hypothetical protein IKE91_03865 [Clostridia bacterium]|nr:hypothetical protein [Clostridia bacterium]
MARCEGRKGAAIQEYSRRMKATKDIVKGMPYRDKSIIAAVYADGKSYRINGCEGMEKVPESVRIIGKHGDMYKVVWGNSKNVVEVGRSELSNQIDSYFGVEQTSKESKATSHDTVDHDEDR